MLQSLENYVFLDNSISESLIQGNNKANYWQRYLRKTRLQNLL